MKKKLTQLFFQETRDDHLGLNPRVSKETVDAQISFKIEDFEKFDERRCEIMKKMQKGFTLIELLIVIAIIGILAGVILVSTSSARQKAGLATVRQTLSSLKSAVTLCCSDGTSTLGATAGSDVCTPAISSTLPGTISSGITAAYAVANACTTTNPGYTVTITGASLPAACTGGTNTWSVSTTGVTPPAGC